MLRDTEATLDQAFEALGHQRPPLFEDVTRVLNASTNPNKVKAINGWLTDLHLVNGCTELMAQPRPTGGEEADWHSAVLVSRDKVDTLVGDISGEPGGITACFGSDVVFWLEGVPLLNLSRKQDLDGEVLDEAIGELQRVFGRPQTTVRWDVALSASRKGLKKGSGIKATVAESIQITYGQIEPALIRELFKGDIVGALGRNTRVRLIDDSRLQEQIRVIEILPIQTIIAPDTGDLREDQTSVSTDLQWCKGEVGFESIRDTVAATVVGGLPRRERLEDLLNMVPSMRGLKEWKLV